MRATVIVKLTIAVLVGLLAALATYDLIKSPVDCSKVACGRDSPGPLF